MISIIKNILKKNGIQIKRYPDYDIKRRMKIVSQYHINTLFDIGANIGQYATNMRELGYSNRIISFEPLQGAFEHLKIASQKDNNWTVNNYALGNEDMQSVINVAGNSYSSSILNMLPMHLRSSPDSEYTSQQEIKIKKLDSVFNSFCSKEDKVMIKIDTQGYEKNVIEGANESLDKISIIQVEMSVMALYENEMLIADMIKYLDNKGFQLFSLENAFSDPATDQLLQVDGIFYKKAL